jgi:hypothetical protein
MSSTALSNNYSLSFYTSFSKDFTSTAFPLEVSLLIKDSFLSLLAKSFQEFSSSLNFLYLSIAFCREFK